MVIAYARVSTDAQELNRQIDMLDQYGYDRLYEEKITGTHRNRPELNNMLSIVREGDVVVVESLSRLGRSTKDLLNIMQELKDKGGKIVSLKEKIETDTAAGQLMVTVLSAISQFERDTIVGRAKEGIQSAKNRGIRFGRPKTDESTIGKIVAMYKSGQYSYKEIADIVGVSVSTVNRYLSEYRNG